MGDRNVFILHDIIHFALMRAVFVHCGLGKSLLLSAIWGFQRQSTVAQI